MKLVLKCSSSNENFNGGCEYAFVHLTPELASTALRRIKQRREMAESDPDLWDVYYWNHDALYFGVDPDETPAELPARIQKLVDPLDHCTVDEVTVPDTFRVPEKFIARTECDQMVVSDIGVSFFCYPKHCDQHITTARIDIQALQGAAQLPNLCNS